MRKPIQVTGERILSSYDVNDLLTGRSYIKFYAGKAGTSGDVLSSVVFASSSIFSKGTDTFTVNFDATVQTPFLVQGDALVKMHYGSEGPGGTPERTCTPTVLIVHYNGTTETTLGTMVFPASGVVSIYVTQCMKATLAKKAFKIGDTLRLKVTITVGGSANGYPGFFHDPEGRTVSTYDGTKPASPEDSKLYALIPFIPNI